MNRLSKQLINPVILAVMILFLVPGGLSGQGRNEEVTIIAPYIPSIQNATKIPFRPESGNQSQEQQPMQYDYIKKSIPVTIALDPIEPMKFNEEKQEDLYGNFLKAGFGNYVTPYLDFLASSKQSEKYLVGVRLKHLSSQGGLKNYADNAYSHNLFAGSGSAFLKSGTVSGNIGYNRDVVHYYGFPLDSFPEKVITEDELKQRFQHFNIGLGFEGQNQARNQFRYNINTDFHFFNDRYDTREIQYDLNAGFSKQLASSNRDFSHAFAMDFGLEYLGYKDTLVTFSPTLINLAPIYRFGIGQYSFEAGLNLYYTSEKRDSLTNSQIDIFPHLRAEIVIIEGELKFYAQLDGNRHINSYRGLAGINPYMVSTPTLLVSNRPFRIFGGLTGSVSGVNFNVEASYSYNDAMPLFVNDTSIDLQNKFQVIYDDINLLNIKASVGILKVRSLDARLLASFYHYIPKNEEKAWHLPSMEVGLDVAYTIKERYILRGDFMILGPGYARTFEGSSLEPKKLKTAIDLNLGFEYRITSRISAFLNVNNLLNQKYQRWYQYPVQGIQGMIGITFSF